MSSLVKSQGRLWDLSKYDQAERYNFDSLQRQLKAARPAPMSPVRLASEMRLWVASGEVSFSTPTDIDVVLRLYERAFLTAITEFAYNHTSIASKPGELFYRNLKWGDQEAEDIEGALQFAAMHCTPLGDRVFHIFQGNDFSQEAKQRIRAACEANEKIKVDD